MTYTVLARRYRSREFDEVVGQEPIARTLQRAIESGRTAHAYLFSGTRGVGKTSMARIFAKAINVNDDLADRDAIADAIMRGEDLDVIEIDGASNNRVEDARELIANSIYRPARSPYKIYIIDEVHMLSNSAFNALLKTMEEPPAHVKFILCTTEPEKVPATIQSRCQRFDFRAIPHNRIVEHLRNVLRQEEVVADDAVVHHVARLGNGSMRDALSVLERLLATGEKQITRELLENTLGLPDFDLITQLVNAVAAGDAGGVLNAAGELGDRGISTDQMLDALIDFFREIMIVHACGPASKLVQFATEAEREERVAQARRFDLGGLVHTIVVLENVQRAAKGSGAAKALVEAALVRLAMSEQVANLAAVLRDPRMIGRLPVTTTNHSAAHGPAAAPGGPDAVSADGDPRKKKRLTEPTEGDRAPASDPPAAPATGATRATDAPRQATPAVPSAQVSGIAPLPSAAVSAEASAPAPAAPAAPAAPTAPTTEPPVDVHALWNDLVHTAEAENPGVSAVADALHLVAIEGGRTGLLEVRDESLRRFAETKEKPIAEMLSRLCGRPMSVRFLPAGGSGASSAPAGGGPAAEGRTAGAGPAASGRDSERGVPERPAAAPVAARPPEAGPRFDPAEAQALREEATRDPLVRQALSLLGARIVHVKRVPRSEPTSPPASGPEPEPEPEREPEGD